MSSCLILPKRFLSLSTSSLRVEYKQGQYNEAVPKIREYFYYVDHNGMLFLDDARMKNFTSCFKDPAFLTFFFRNLKVNPYTDSYKDAFPYVSLCGIERNYVRCEDLPVVFTKLIKDNSKLTYGHTDLSVDFVPSALEFNSTNGRLYHPTFLPSPKVQKGLLRSKLLDELSTRFIYDKDNVAVGIRWEDDDKPILFSKHPN